MENLQKYEKNIETLKANIELKTQELSQQRKLIEEDNIRLEGMRKFVDPSIKSQIMVDAMNQSNIQVDKEIENNKKKIEKAEDGIKRMHEKIESNKHSLKEGIDNNREEAKKNKSMAFAKYAIKHKEFNKNIEKGRQIKLKLKVADTKEAYKAASEEQATHLQHMKELAKERNEAWKLYNEASKENDKVLEETQELLNKYNLEENSKKIDEEQKENNQQEENKEEENQTDEEQRENNQQGEEEKGQEKTENEQEDNSVNKREDEKQEGKEQEDYLKLENKYDMNEYSKDRKLSIYISELDGTIERKYIDEELGVANSQTTDLLVKKGKLYKNLEISKMCKELAGGRIKGYFLQRKLNPSIVNVLQDDKEMLGKYAKAIKEEEQLPFELTHDLNGLNGIRKFMKQRSRVLKMEEKCGAQILGKLFNKNETIEEAKYKHAKPEDQKILNDLSEQGLLYSEEKKKRKLSEREDIKVKNKDNHIEKTAKENIKKEEEITSPFIKMVNEQANSDREK